MSTHNVSMNVLSEDQCRFEAHANHSKEASPCHLQGHTESLRSVDVMQGYAISASEDATARIWDLACQSEIVCLGHSHGVIRALFAPASTLVATHSRDGGVRLFDVRVSPARPLMLVQQHAECCIGRVQAQENTFIRNQRHVNPRTL